MSENNLPNEGFENETTEEITEQNEVIEETEAVEEAEACACGCEECACEECEPVSCEDDECKAKFELLQKRAKNMKTCAIIAWVVAAVLVCVDGWYAYTHIYNKYNHLGYYDIDGYTVGDIVSSMGMDFDDFKEMYGLPKDMRKDTNLNAAQALIKLSNMAELNGIDFEDLKERYKFSDDITEDMTFGEGIDSMTIADYLDMSGAEDDFETFKTTYGISDDITEDMSWGKVRKIYEKAKVAEREAEEKEKEAEKKAEKEAEKEEITPDTDEDVDDTIENNENVSAESEE